LQTRDVAVVQIPEFGKDLTAGAVWSSSVDGFETRRAHFSPEGLEGDQFLVPGDAFIRGGRWV
jgi:hypothetical protein